MKGLGPGEGTWTCHVCGRTRPDALIDVMKIDATPAGLPPGTVVRNVRYCNDTPACAIGAREFVTGPVGKGTDAHTRR